MGFKRDVLAGYASAVASVAAPILAIPLYVAGLGLPAWGLVTIGLLAVAIATLLEAGIGHALTREFSVAWIDDARDGSARYGALLGDYARKYARASLWSLAVGAIVAPVVAIGWIDPDGALANSTKLAGMWMVAALVAATVYGLVYRSALLGSEAVATVGWLTAAAQIARHAGGAVIVGVSTDPVWVLAWFTAISIGEAVGRRTLARRRVPARHERAGLPGMSPSSLEQPASEGIRQMMIAAWLSVAGTQIDKVVLSGQVGLDQYAVYSLAWMLSSGLLQLSAPISQAALPRLVRVRHQPVVLLGLGRRWMLAYLAAAPLAGVAYSVLGAELVTAWLGDAAIAQSVMPALTLLLLGSFANLLYQVNYTALLAAGDSPRIVRSAAVACGLAAACALPLVMQWGILGAAATWLLYNSAALMLTAGWLVGRPHR